MDIELTVAERLGLLALLPHEANLTTLRIVQRLRMDLSFEEEEYECLQFQETDGRIVWNPEVEQSKIVKFGATAMQIVQDKLTELDKQGKLRVEHLSLCDKFGLE